MNSARPQALLVDLGPLGGRELAAPAMALFRSGSVSAGFATRLAEKPLAEMLTLLSSQGIALTSDGPAAAEEALEGMSRARKWLVSKPGV